MNLKTVAFQTFGCKLNFSETATISRRFKEHGYQIVDFDGSADVYVINTCSVTENADKRFRETIRRLRKHNPHAKIAAVGCLAQLQSQRVDHIDGVDLLLGTNDKFKVLEYLTALVDPDTTQIHSCEISNVRAYDSSYSLDDRTRAFLKVQDGCDYKCTYCTIPLARGISRSDSIVNLVQSAKEIVSKGIKEIVLTGVNIGDFGTGRKETFLDLLKTLDEVKGLERLRISSIEPNLLTDEIISFVAKSKTVVPHFHVPLQSGTDEILAKMKRRYKTKLYRDRIERIKQELPQACIGADVIVGFLGETEELFYKTRDFIVDLELSYLHVFSYSERAQTEAIHMEGSVDKGQRHQRSKILRELSERIRTNYYQKQLGKTLNALFEHNNKDGYIQGFTDNYVRIKKPWNPQYSGTLKPVTLLEVDVDGVVLCV